MGTYVYVLPVANTDPYVNPLDEGTTPDEWLSIGEAAALMHQSISTLRRYDSRGVLKADRTLGGQRRYRRSAIEAALRQPAA